VESPYLVGPWTEVTNNVIAQQCDLWSDRFVGIAQLPQSRDLDSDNCVRNSNERTASLRRRDGHPDPGGDGLTPGMNDEYWYALYEAPKRLR